MLRNKIRVLFKGPDRKCRSSDLAVIWQASESESFHWLEKTIAQTEGFESKSKRKSVKTKNTVSFR